jgi:hypothetical protein
LFDSPRVIEQALEKAVKCACSAGSQAGAGWIAKQAQMGAFSKASKAVVSKLKF